MKAYIEIMSLDVNDVITTSMVPPDKWGDGNTTPPIILAD